MSTATVAETAASEKQAGARARAAIASELESYAQLGEPGVPTWFEITRRGLRIHVRWNGLPLESEMSRMLEVHRGKHGHPIELSFSRRGVWSCGEHHEDELAAWVAHEGAAYVEEMEHGYGETAQVVRVTDLQALLQAGESLTSSCQPGEFAPCPWCQGSGTQRQWDTLRMAECGACAGQRVYDVSEQAGVEGWRAAMARIPALAAEVERARG